MEHRSRTARITVTRDTNERKTLPAILILLLLALSPATLRAAEVAPLPELGDPAGGLISPDQEYRMGRAWLRQLRAQVPVLDDPLVQEYVEHLVYRLASHSDLKAPDLAIVVINSPDINAFAVPGGVVGMNAGLITNAHQEDEVAAVIAHEIAHISQRHFVRRYADSQRLNRAMLAAMLASIAVAIAGDGDAGMAGLMASQAAVIQQQLAYSRHHEREADRVGMQTLVNAGMDPQAMPRFFERLQRNRQFAGRPLEFLSTHPITEERIADSRARASALPAGNATESAVFHLVRARLMAGYFSDPQQAMAHFRSQYRDGNSLQQQAAGYGLAISAIRAKDYPLAGLTIDRLRQRFPDQLWYRIVDAELAQHQQRYDEAIIQLTELSRLMPGNYAISVMLANNKIRAGQHAEASELLTPLLRQRPQDVALWRLAADAWGHNNQLALAHMARGEVLFLSGRDDRGKEQLGYALNHSKENFPLHSRIKARVREMDAESKERF
ncbi:MAG: peptidase M48 [Gammaproteobacteria bacterium HGW-Gammaproteobacteria-14]|nr:MAG: peptidase M48 [Gammaproteobacteria bacterium HGW-Gammaproteobacteria-14]